MTTPYEQLTSEDYWQDAQVLPKHSLGRRMSLGADCPNFLKRIYAHIDYHEISKTERSVIQLSLGKLGATRTIALDTSHQVLPKLDELGFFKLTVDTRTCTDQEPEYLIDSGAKEEFNEAVTQMQSKSYIGERATASVVNPSGGFFEISRSIVYARTNERREIFGFESHERERNQEQGYTLPTKVVLPPLELGTTYSSLWSDIKISHAEQTTLLNQSDNRKNRGDGETIRVKRFLGNLGINPV